MVEVEQRCGCDIGLCLVSVDLKTGTRFVVNLSEWKYRNNEEACTSCIADIHVELFLVKIMNPIKESRRE